MMLLDKIPNIRTNGKGQEHCFRRDKFAADNKADDEGNHWIPKPELAFVFSQINIPSNNHTRKKHNKNRKYFAACNEVEEKS